MAANPRASCFQMSLTACLLFSTHTLDLNTYSEAFNSIDLINFSTFVGDNICRFNSPPPSLLFSQDDHKLTLEELHRKYGTDLTRVSVFVLLHVSEQHSAVVLLVAIISHCHQSQLLCNLIINYPVILMQLVSGWTEFVFVNDIMLEKQENN